MIAKVLLVVLLISWLAPGAAFAVKDHRRPSFLSVQGAASGAAFQQLVEPSIMDHDDLCEVSPAPVSVIKLTWEPEIAETIRRVIVEQTELQDSVKRPFMVAVVGIPGSGKVRRSSINIGRGVGGDCL
jgi:hypothetical protein